MISLSTVVSVRSCCFRLLKLADLKLDIIEMVVSYSSAWRSLIISFFVR